MLTNDPDLSLVPRHDRVLAAVSGGADSLALLHWLVELGRDVVVGHVNHDLHELRSGDCDVDEAFVAGRAAELGVPFVSETVQLPRKGEHVNEAVARDARYRALVSMARLNGCNRLATGHTADDGLETLLLNLLRGPSLRGFAGIPPCRELTTNLLLVRPFWRVPRAGTRAMLQAGGHTWREDDSNRATVFRRNRIRHEVLPLLGEIAGREPGQLAADYAASAMVLRDELDFQGATALAALGQIVRERTSERVILDAPALMALHPALQRRVIRLSGQEVAPEAPPADLAHVEAMRAAIDSGARRTVWSLEGGLRVEWTGTMAGNRLRFWCVRTRNEGLET